MSAAILSIGTEITRGEITNTNASWLAEELTRDGLEVAAIDTVADDRDDIQRALLRLAERHTLIVCTGGLGPTTDDITAECVARAIGVPLERHAPSLDALRERLSRHGRPLTDSNAKQADLPKGASPLPNAHGTAPGFSVRIGSARAFFLPGVPGEMKPMFSAFVAPEVRSSATEGICQVRLKTFGLPESTVNDRLAGVEAAHRVTIGYRAHFPEIEVKVLARRDTAAVAEADARRAAEEVRARLAEFVYAEGDVTFGEAVCELLRSRSLTLGTAESCTGGLVAELLTERAGASDVFRGAVVAYANSVKENVLGVDARLIAENGAVSAQVARAMAEGARRVLGADLAVAITGVAGPGGGTDTKPVGLVHYAVATGAVTVDRRAEYPGTRRQIQLRAAFVALALVRETLLG